MRRRCAGWSLLTDCKVFVIEVRKILTEWQKNSGGRLFVTYKVAVLQKKW